MNDPILGRWQSRRAQSIMSVRADISEHGWSVLEDDLRVWQRASAPEDAATSKSVPSVVLPAGTKIKVLRRFKLQHGGSPNMAEVVYFPPEGEKGAGLPTRAHGVVRWDDLRGAAAFKQVDHDPFVSVDSTGVEYPCCSEHPLDFKKQHENYLKLPGSTRETIDVPMMSPADRQQRIDALLDRWSKEPEKREEIERHLRELRAFAALWMLRTAGEHDHHLEKVKAAVLEILRSGPTTMVGVQDILYRRGIEFPLSHKALSELMAENLIKKDDMARVRIAPGADDNVACESCGRHDLPLHTNGMCAKCAGPWLESEAKQFNHLVKQTIHYIEQELSENGPRDPANLIALMMKPWGGIDPKFFQGAYEKALDHLEQAGKIEWNAPFNSWQITGTGPDAPETPADVPGMKPAERQKKIDALLDRWNKEPAARPQIEEQLKSLRAFSALFMLRHASEQIDNDWECDDCDHHRHDHEDPTQPMWAVGKCLAAGCPCAKFGNEEAENAPRPNHGPGCFCQSCVDKDDMSTHRCPSCGSMECPGDGDSIDCRKPGTMTLKDVPVETRDSLLDKFNKGEIDAETLRRRMKQITSSMLGRWRLRRAEGADPAAGPFKAPWPDQIQAFMQAVYDQTVAHPFSRGQRVWNDEVILEVSPWAGGPDREYPWIINLKWLQSMTPGKGHARAALQWLGALADEYGVFMELEAKPTGTPKIPKKKLINLYKDEGFTSKDQPQDMQRQPLSATWKARRAEKNPDGSVNWDTVEAVAEQARAIMIETNPDADHRPLSMCGVASEALAQELIKLGLQVDEVRGVFLMEMPGYGGGYDEVGPESFEAEHSWLEVDGKIIDISADQFNEYLHGGPYPPVFIGTNDGRWVEKSRRPAKLWKMDDLTAAALPELPAEDHFAPEVLDKIMESNNLLWADTVEGMALQAMVKLQQRNRALWDEKMAAESVACAYGTGDVKEVYATPIMKAVLDQVMAWMHETGQRRASRAPDFSKFRPDIASGWMNLLREHGVKETVPQNVVDAAVETSIENLMHSYIANGDGEDAQSFIAQWFDEDEIPTFVALWMEHANIPVPESLIAAAKTSSNWGSQVTEEEVADFNAKPGQRRAGGGLDNFRRECDHAEKPGGWCGRCEGRPPKKITGGERQSLLKTWLSRRAMQEGPLGWFQDNPITWMPGERGKLWLESHPTTTTAGFNQISLPVSFLIQIPGEHHEERNIDQENVGRIVDWMTKSKDPLGVLDQAKPFVMVKADGSATVFEGNHRLRAAEKMGLESIPLWVHYEGGSEMIDGPYHPDKLRAMARQVTSKINHGLKRQSLFSLWVERQAARDLKVSQIGTIEHGGETVYVEVSTKDLQEWIKLRTDDRIIHDKALGDHFRDLEQRIIDEAATKIDPNWPAWSAAQVGVHDDILWTDIQRVLEYYGMELGDAQQNLSAPGGDDKLKQAVFSMFEQSGLKNMSPKQSADLLMNMAVVLRDEFGMSIEDAKAKLSSLLIEYGGGGPEDTKDDLGGNVGEVHYNSVREQWMLRRSDARMKSDLREFLSGSAITRPVYHGSPEQFSVFDKAKVQSPEGFFFTTDELDARDYGDNIMTCYLSIKNPLEVTVEDWQNASDEGAWQKMIAGHDGIHVTGNPDHEDELYRNDFWIAFSPDQIKVVKTDRLGSRLERWRPRRAEDNRSDLQKMADQIHDFIKSNPMAQMPEITAHIEKLWGYKREGQYDAYFEGAVSNALDYLVSDEKRAKWTDKGWRTMAEPLMTIEEHLRGVDVAPGSQPVDSVMEGVKTVDPAAERDRLLDDFSQGKIDKTVLDQKLKRLAATKPLLNKGKKYVLKSDIYAWPNRFQGHGFKIPAGDRVITVKDVPSTSTSTGVVTFDLAEEFIVYDNSRNPYHMRKDLCSTLGDLEWAIFNIEGSNPEAPEAPTRPSNPSDLTVRDVPTMDPRDQKAKIDSLLDAINAETDPTKKQQIMERLRSLRASLRQTFMQRRASGKLRRFWREWAGTSQPSTQTASKAAFHKEATRVLKTLAVALGLEEGSYDLRSNKGGNAVMGEVTLHSDDIYVQIGGSSQGLEVMYRTVNGRGDYSGGKNNWMKYEDVENTTDAAAKISNLLNKELPSRPKPSGAKGAMTLETERGARYEILSNGNIVRLDIKGFEPSGQWKLVGIESPNGAFIPFEAFLSHGLPKSVEGWTIIDFDHGTTRAWGEKLRAISIKGNPPWENKPKKAPAAPKKPEPVQQSTPDLISQIEVEIIDLLRKGPSTISRELTELPGIDPRMADEVSEVIGRMLDRGDIRFDGDTAEFSLLKEPEPTEPEHLPEMSNSDMQARTDALLDQLSKETDPAKKKQIEQRLRSLQAYQISVNMRFGGAS